MKRLGKRIKVYDIIENIRNGERFYFHDDNNMVNYLYYDEQTDMIGLYNGHEHKIITEDDTIKIIEQNQ